MIKTYKVVHLFCGIGGGALGFQRARREYRGLEGHFETVLGIDSDPLACADFEYLTGARDVQMDLFSREQYAAWHGHEPPEDWREVTAEDLRAAAGEVPDMVFTSPPCKGFSALLPAKSANTPRYQALNGLTIRGIRLAAEAWAPSLILMENVPRILSRGKKFLEEIKATLAAYGYVFHESTHDCGEIGGLGQRRQRYLLIARNPAKLPAFVYQPRRYPLKSIGDIIGPMPMPGDPEAGPMHRLPNLHWLTWLRLALIPAGGDWRDLERCGWEDLRIEHEPRKDAFRIQPWEEPACTVTGNAKPGGSTPATVGDPRPGVGKDAHTAIYRIVRWNEAAGALCVADNRVPGKQPVWAGDYKRTQISRVYGFDETAGTITGSANIHGAGVSIVADPRREYPGMLGVQSWDKPAGAVTGMARPSCGSTPASIADPRVNDRDGRQAGHFQVNVWDDPSRTVTGKKDIQCGAMSIADPRPGYGPSRHGTNYRITSWDNAAGTVTGGTQPSEGALSVSDPRLGCKCRDQTYGVTAWDQAASTISGNLDVHTGAAAVADVRIPDRNEAGQWVIISLDGTWHRPLTTLELAALQGLPLTVNGAPLKLAGNSEQRWREGIGNAVPVGAGEGIGNAMLDALLANEYHEIMYSTLTELWVRIMLARVGIVRIRGNG